jgi:hypothetical protein
MAKLPNSAVVLRFRLGKGLVKARQRYSNTARAILERITLQYAEGAYDQFRKDVEMRLEGDVRMELEHMAALFRRHIIGFAGRRTSPSGTLTTATKGGDAPRQSIASGLPPWAPRNAQYLKTKRMAVGHIRWFDNTGWNAHGPDLRYARISERTGEGPDSPGLLKSFFKGESWESLFGPISVRFFRARKLEPEDAVGNIASKGRHMKVQIGSFFVRALGKIEPHMLPGYTAGAVRASASGNPRLMNVIAQTDPRIAYRLGTMRNGVYRPTLEPFLGFFLTRALPFAVQRRIEKGTLGSIIIR